MTAASDCIFCRIAAGEIPAQKVYENDDVVAFLDIAPLAEGHVLLIPREHADTIDQATPKTAEALGRALPTIVAAVQKVTGAAGVNVLQNNGEAAGQEVRHVHVHLIPRTENDGLGYRWKPTSYPEGRADEVADAFRKALA